MGGNFDDLIDIGTRSVGGEIAAQPPVHAGTTLRFMCFAPSIRNSCVDCCEVVRKDSDGSGDNLQDAAKGVPLGAARRLVQIIPDRCRDGSGKGAGLGSENSGPSCAAHTAAQMPRS